MVGRRELANDIKTKIFHCAKRQISTRKVTFQQDMEKALARSQEEADMEKALARSQEEAECKRPELPLAIQQAGLHLKLDADTPGLGNCFSIAMVQQFERPRVKRFLQSIGIKINSFMELKKNVNEFVYANMHTAKMLDLRLNFEMSQRSMAEENDSLTPRTWDEYWSDMLVNGKWADDTFIQACAWYTNMNIAIVSARYATPERPFYSLEGTFATETTGPTLLVGFVNKHYQSLLPLQEDEEEDTKEEQTKSRCVQEEVQPLTKTPSVPTPEAVQEEVVMSERTSYNETEVISLHICDQHIY